MATFTAVDDSQANFQIKLFSGNATDDTAITFDGETDMQPDFMWLKNRDASGDHSMVDVVRGVTKYFTASGNDEEQTYTNSVKSFNSDGFTLGTRAIVNGSGNGIVAWSWKAGGSASAQTDGTIDTSRSVNTTAGFSIATYSGNSTNGATRGHGLGVVPQWIMVKQRTDAQKWYVYHHKNTAAPETDYLELNTTAATVDQAGWNDTAPSSTLVTTSDGSEVNASSKDYVMYSWAGVQGFSHFSSYVGNGLTGNSGNHINTGFRPAWVMIKKTSAVGSWLIYDSKRASTGNVPEGTTGVNSYLEHNTGTEQGDNPIIFFSNGFQVRDSLNQADGATYIYMAFAEQPMVNSSGVPNNAR